MPNHGRETRDGGRILSSQDHRLKKVRNALSQSKTSQSEFRRLVVSPLFHVHRLLLYPSDLRQRPLLFGAPVQAHKFATTAVCRPPLAAGNTPRNRRLPGPWWRVPWPCHPPRLTDLPVAGLAGSPGCRDGELLYLCSPSYQPRSASQG